MRALLDASRGDGLVSLSAADLGTFDLNKLRHAVSSNMIAKIFYRGWRSSAQRLGVRNRASTNTWSLAVGPLTA
jgi:hypothetical protein